MSMRICLILAAMAVTLQAWSIERYILPNQEKYCSLRYLSYNTGRFRDRCGKCQKNFNHCSLKEVKLELDYGATACDTVELKERYGFIDEELDGKTYAFDDMEVYWNHLFTAQYSTCWGTRLIGIIPLKKTYAPGFRYGRYGIEGGVFCVHHASIGNARAHLYGDAGYRWYQGFPSDQLRSKVGITLCLPSGFSLDINSQVEFGLFNGKERLDQSLVLMNPNYRLWKGEIEAIFCLCKGIDVSVGGFINLLGQNSGSGGGFFSRASLCF